jgi:hypothetical protein
MFSHAGKQEAMSRDPAGGLEHGECAMNEVRRGVRSGQRGQRSAQRFGVGAEAAQPKLAALVR